VLTGDEYVDIEAFKKIALGSRLKTAPVSQIGITTLLEKLNKEFPGTQEFYECLCELSHPNMFGVLSHYCVPDFDKASFHKHPPLGRVIPVI